MVQLSTNRSSNHVHIRLAVCDVMYILYGHNAIVCKFPDMHVQVVLGVPFPPTERLELGYSPTMHRL